MAEITIRQALATDIPQAVHIELTSHAKHPIIALPWKQYSHKYGVILSRQLHFISFPKKYQYLVATSPSASKLGEEEVVGYLVGSTPKNTVNGIGGEQVEEWKPIYPEETDVKFVEYFLGNVHKNGMEFKSDDMWELETLSISVDHQRKGVGSKLMDEWLKTVDADGRALYILSSKIGVGLYERLGAKQVSLLETDMKDFGVELPHVNFNMVREGKKV